MRASKKSAARAKSLPEAAQSPSDGVAAARDAGLIYVSDADPGIRRIRAGNGFVYRDAKGRRVRDAEHLARIRKLAIPPAYDDVWICASARGHLQATGRDARGRKQYRYHARWSSVRGSDKFGRLIDFGGRLPRLRNRVRRDLRLTGLPREKVLAVAVALLAETLIRVGNAEYARSNKSFGLTTLRARHIAFLRDGRARLSFRGKSGLAHEIAIDDRRLIRVLRRCQHLPGQALFQYLDDDGKRQPIDSGQVNAYLQVAMGDDFTAKDFRTWAGTIEAIALLAQTPLPERASERALASAIAAVVKRVATDLRNTPAVCRSSYIHPDVFESWRDGSLHARVPAPVTAHPRQLEASALRWLKSRRRGRDAAPAQRRPKSRSANVTRR